MLVAALAVAVVARELEAIAAMLPAVAVRPMDSMPLISTALMEPIESEAVRVMVLAAALLPVRVPKEVPSKLAAVPVIFAEVRNVPPLTSAPAAMLISAVERVPAWAVTFSMLFPAVSVSAPPAVRLPPVISLEALIVVLPVDMLLISATSAAAATMVAAVMEELASVSPAVSVATVEALICEPVMDSPLSIVTAPVDELKAEPVTEPVALREAFPRAVMEP